MLADAHDTLAALGGERSSRGILKIRDEVDKLRQRFGMRELVLERLRHHAVFVGVDCEIACLIRIERMDRAQIRRILQHHVVARIDQYLGDQIQALL